MNARILLPAALFLTLSGIAHASGSTILGGALGGAAGAAVGESVGGRDGAVIGGALGGSVGAAIGYDNRSEPTRYVEPRHRDYPRYREWDDEDDNDQGRGRGYFCPPGQAKKGRC